MYKICYTTISRFNLNYAMYKFVYNKLNFHLVILLWILLSHTNFCSSFQLNRSDYGQNDSHQIYRRQTSKCASTQFTCKSRDCIEESMLCDGVKDCKDGSDETIHECKDLACPSYSFRCNYGACIEAALKCDGRKDCADNSDETHITCPANLLNAGITKKCKANEWKCKGSGKCILEDAKCDGRKDCDDGSDETLIECENSLCPAFKFRCNYGACVDMSARCNGVQDCPDGSDEHCSTSSVTRPIVSPTRPTIITPPPTTGVKPANGVCDVPYGADKTIVITDNNDNLLNVSPGSKAPKHSQIEITCDSQSALSNGDKVQRSVCFQKEKWNPPLKPCLSSCSPYIVTSSGDIFHIVKLETENRESVAIRNDCMRGEGTCPKLNPVNVDLSCHREGQEVDCSGDLINGTRVRPRCKALYHEEKEVYYRELRCQEDGKWDNDLFKCVPDCGAPSPVSLIFEGKPSVVGDSPWHVAIYRLSIDHTLICGGTLISANMVISAAHCFFDEAQGVAVNTTSDYEIVVSKYTRDYNTHDSNTQEIYKIKSIIFADVGFNPTLTNHFGQDIIVLVLQTAVKISKSVLPACVQWSSTTEGFQPAEGTPGKLVGWGVDKVANVGSPTLLAAELPFISYHKCVGKIKNITPDKFCAGSEKGAVARKGDSGGGLMFRDPNNGRYYLRGIVSTTDRDSPLNIATFTDISKHLDWLYKVRIHVEREIIKSETTLNPKVDNRIG